jgi:hypothetical protein
MAFSSRSSESCANRGASVFFTGRDPGVDVVLIENAALLNTVAAFAVLGSEKHHAACVTAWRLRGFT